MPAGLQRYYGRGHLHFITLQLLSPSAAFEDRARDPNDNPKTQVQTANLGHPPRCCGSRNERSLLVRSTGVTEKVSSPLSGPPALHCNFSRI